MKSSRRMKAALVWLAIGGLAFQTGGCNLSDRQVAQIIQSVITTSLNSTVNTVLSGLLAQQQQQS